MIQQRAAIIQQNLMLWRDIVSYWKLDDNAASATVTDVIGGRNGYLCYGYESITNRNTNTASVAGKINTGFEFKTTESYDQRVGVRVADSDAFTFGNGTTDSPFSVSCWVYLAGYGVDMGGGILGTFIMSKRYLVTDGSEWQIIISDFGSDVSPRYVIRLFLYSAKNKTNYVRYQYDLGGDILGSWKHFTFTYNGLAPADGAGKIYMNGSLLSLDVKIETGTYVAMDNTTSELGIGCFALTHTNNGFSVNGIIDEVGLWKRELSATEAKLLYSFGNGRKFYK
jgi:hypothetical protein